jgi:two-component system, chemotaxis family, protein-glutamate methylesterase/glutaminase
MSEQAPSHAGHDIIVIGTSVGGIEAVTSLLGQLPAALPAKILMVIHLHPNSPCVLDRLLAAKTKLKVKFAQHEEPLQNGTVYLAPPDQHLLIKDGKALLSHGPRENRSRPAIDPLFRAAAVGYSTRVIGIVLTGMLDDGTTGLQAVKECGGIAIVQHPEDAQYPEMPASALKAVAVDHVATLSEMGALLMRLTALPALKPVPVPEHWRREMEISQGAGSPDMEENIMGELVPIVCPECGGALSALHSGQSVSYRCHEGHAFGQLSLLGAQYEKMETALWAAVRIMVEQANMLKKMAENSTVSGKHYMGKAEEIITHSQHIRDFLFHIMERRV